MGEPHPSLLSGYGTSDTTGPLGGILRWIHRLMPDFVTTWAAPDPIGLRRISPLSPIENRSAMFFHRKKTSAHVNQVTAM